MKKYLYIAIAAATLASCSQDDTLDAIQGEAIQFGNVFVGKSTRAAEATDPSYSTTTGKGVALTAFKVYGTVGGVNIFDGDNVTKGTAAYGDAWGCDGGAQYWVAGANYVFDAVVDATVTTTDETTGMPTSLNYKVSTQKDMLHQRVTTTGQPTANNGLVAFQFTHLLSKVKFTVSNTSNSNATNYRYTITDIVITNAYTEGDCSVPAHTWSNQVAGTYNIYDMTVSSNTTEECATEVLLIPGANIGISFNLNVQIKNGDKWETISTVPFSKTEAVTLVANNAYNFKATYAMGGDIQFTAVQMPEWTSGGDVVVPQQ